ncbi:lytic murein transglycosylase [Bombella apis]|uniref:lytic murein transglycosylase n=1 Tax=Bombella apis TaxID=1785988 RepID=UPI0012BA26E5|nr:lytic murein transglycosylase [Bombella apis]
MMKRRHFLAATAGGVMMGGLPAWAGGRAVASRGTADYAAFLGGVRQQALSAGVPSAIVEQSLALAQAPNQEVLRLDRHQPEFTLTWAQYRARVISSAREEKGRQAWQRVRGTLSPLGQTLGCDDNAIMGIWGLESGFGEHQGRFNVIEALATLAFDGRRAAFFRSELIKAMQILAQGAISPASMLGSYAGAMGQPQFMPSAYLRFAADGDGDGKANIWSSEADVFASIANYLGRSGWRRGEPWGEEVVVPLGSNGQFTALAATKSRHAPVHPVSTWQAMGVRPVQSSGFLAPQATGSLLQPDGPGGQAFLVYHNFRAIRAYNPSDYYALAVGILGDRMTR